MGNKNALLFKIEILWWFIAAFFATILLLPIQLQLPSFPHLWLNALMAVSFIILTRHIFFLRYTFIGKLQYLKIALFFISIPFVFFLIERLNMLQVYINEGHLFTDLEVLPYAKQLKLEVYIRTEILLITTATIIAAVIFAFRMLVSVWRYRNRGTI
jgi:hypothetical protein